MADPLDQHKEKVSLKEKLKTTDFGWRLFIGFALVVVLTLFLHFRETRVEILELDTVAKKYVVAQVDFEFPDEEATTIDRQDAVRGVGAIYKIDESQIDKRFEDFTNKISKGSQWSRDLPGVEFDVLYNASQDVETALEQARFTDNRTLQKIRSLKLSSAHYYLYTPRSTSQPGQLPQSFWSNLEAQVMQMSSSPQTEVSYVIRQLQVDPWQLKEDIASQRQLRQVVGMSVPVKSTKVRAGSRIIDQGEKVTMRHISMLQSMKKAKAKDSNIGELLPLLGDFIFAVLVVVMGVLYFRIFHAEVFRSLQKLAIFATVFIVTIALSKGCEYFLLETSHHLIEVVRYPLFAPFAAILICILVDDGVALFTAIFLSVLLTLTLAVEQNRFLIMNLITGIAAIIATRGVRKRKEVFVVCGKVWLSCLPILIAFNFSRNAYWDVPFASDVLSTLFFMLMTAILVVGFLPILESVFRVMTDITLMEFMDPNNELLRKLSIEAPGTYQHSLVVGSLAERAAQAIGANGLFCRVASMYHDIGKLFNPHYFTENQMGAFNIHQLLTPVESTQVIMAHVPEGEALAKKYTLPKSFSNIIREHHGTTLVYYFYSKEVEQKGGDVDAVDEKQFRYGGPKPRTRESAIIMISDSVEAASRSLDEEVNEEILTELVNRIVADKAEEGQFDECQLTFEELGIVKRTVLKDLILMKMIKRPKFPKPK